MRVTHIIDDVMEWPSLPVRLTYNHDEKWVRVLGVLAFIVWIGPCMLVSLAVTAVLVIPSMIQDAWHGR